MGILFIWLIFKLELIFKLSNKSGVYVCKLEYSWYIFFCSLLIISIILIGEVYVMYRLSDSIDIEFLLVE